MDRASEYAQEQQEIENLSGSDLAECWYEHNRRIISKLGELNKIIKGESRPSATTVCGAELPLKPF